MSRKPQKLGAGMVQLTLPLSSLPSQERGAESLRASGAVKEALRQALDRCGLSRDTVADELTRLTGETVTVHTVNNWAAQGKSERRIPLDQLAALSIVTGDPGIARAALEPAGLVVLDKDQAIYYELGLVEAEAKQRAEARKAAWAKLKR
ncbi:hypothetical protein EDC59_11395 [Pseudodesulfovibrio indicus]|uniref:Uncharacterized protein n=2 Tax=Pseudodesulfovibrio indicus TaxID=1716143 RepID=A0AA94PRC8_9BACT|nr:hypothetical protein EDC59_11395 [Pseudodesulfovibrio indicus]